ncbi:MAG: hypothetical protein JXM70_02605, partial [Pirellulales bacterium]|nr:hypothetical protein [Pirellulales bacterium]
MDRRIELHGALVAEQLKLNAMAQRRRVAKNYYNPFHNFLVFAYLVVILRIDHKMAYASGYLDSYETA